MESGSSGTVNAITEVRPYRRSILPAELPQNSAQDSSRPHSKIGLVTIARPRRNRVKEIIHFSYPNSADRAIAVSFTSPPYLLRIRESYRDDKRLIAFESYSTFVSSQVMHTAYHAYFDCTNVHGNQSMLIRSIHLKCFEPD